MTAIESVGFTNKPNLTELPALNRQQQEQHPMTLSAHLAAALSLNPATATDADAVTAIDALKSTRSWHLTALNTLTSKVYCRRNPSTGLKPRRIG
ncbi:hypothetical protein P4S70_01270 [Enterovibrio sp. Hal110]